MKIDDSNLPERPDASNNAARRGTAATPTPAPAATAQTTGVNVSPLAAQVREISARLVNESDADIDMEKVDKIRTAISRNELPMDASKIADGLLASLRDLAQPQ